MAKETFTDAEQALIEKIVYAVIDHVMPRIEKAISDGIKGHELECPVKRHMGYAKGFIGGLTVFAGFVAFFGAWLWQRVAEHIFPK
jgi:hypothetical protein